MFQLQQDEYVISYVRKHWIWVLVDLFKVLIFLFIPILIFLYTQKLISLNNFLFFNYPVIKILDLVIYIWIIFSWIYAADRFTKYALNFWVLTNKKLIESEHLLLFSRKLSTLELENVEDVTVKFDGPIETFLNFGSLTVQTAGAQREFLADDVSDPEGVKSKLFGARENLKKEDREVSIKDETIEDEIKIKNTIDKIFEKSLEREKEYHDFEIPTDQKEINNYPFDWGKK